MQQKIEDDLILEMLSKKKSKNQGLKLLMVKYQRPLYYHIKSIVGSHVSTDDVLQETFIKVYKNIDRFQRKSKLYSWLYRIATNEAITFLKKERKNASVSIDNEGGSPDIFAAQYFDLEQGLVLLDEAIIALPEKQKLVFQMKYFDDLPYADISEKLDTSVGALKASFHHAVKKIEKYIKDKMN